MAKKKTKSIKGSELAASTPEKDITKPFTQKLIYSEDTILAERGHHDLKIYEELLRDDQVHATYQQRRSAVIANEWQVMPVSESPRDVQVADFIRENLTCIDFDRITEKMLYGIFFGYAVGEMMWSRRGDNVWLDTVKVRRQRRFRFGRDNQLYLLTPKAHDGELMPRSKFWAYNTGAYHDDEPYGLGLAHFAYWPVFFKRNGLKFWMKFLENFAMPKVMGRLPLATQNNEEQRRNVLEALESIRQDSAVAIPDGVEIELLEISRSGTVDYNALTTAMDGAIAKIFLSQTMTSEATAGQYKAEVQKDVRDEVVRGDSSLMDESFNLQVVPEMVRQNFPEVTDFPRVFRDTEQKEDVNDRAERDTKIYAMGMDPTEEYIQEHYGEGWVKSDREIAPVVAQDFMELQGRLGRSRVANRLDAGLIAADSALLAGSPDPVMADTIQGIVDAAENSAGYAEFSDKINTLLAKGPADDLASSIRNRNIITYLLGLMRGRGNAES